MEAKDKLIVLIEELVKKGINVSDVSIRNDELCYNIEGFAKSGYGTLFIDDGKIKLETRYNQTDAIESLEDIVNVAYDWDWNYCRKDNHLYTVYGVSQPWRKLYEEFELNVDVFR